MSGQRLLALSQKLTGIDDTKGIAVIQQATTPNQKTDVFTFRELREKGLPSFQYVPTLIIIGNVVSLHKQYSWFKEGNTAESYFDNHKSTYKNAI